MNIADFSLQHFDKEAECDGHTDKQKDIRTDASTIAKRC